MTVVSVFLTRLDVRDAVVALLAAPDDGRGGAGGVAVKAEFDGGSVKAVLERVHRYVDEQLADARTYGVCEESVRDDLRALLAGGEAGPGAEVADPEADRDVAHQIIAALAARYPLPPDVLAALPVAE
ncbi:MULTISPECIES: hypothetical protein [unclassified Streptomyces]|uniref:hypothetical protein n=1 Tax=unclassified Streptomyces TaxID=2593676 RepID=UPI0033C9A125